MATKSRLTKAALDRLEARASELTAQARGIAHTETGAYARLSADDYAFMWLHAWHAALLEEQVADAKDPEEEIILDPVRVRGLHVREDLAEFNMEFITGLMNWDKIQGSYVDLPGVGRGTPVRGRPETITLLQVVHNEVCLSTVAAVRDKEHYAWIDRGELKHDPLTEEE